jgi:hypothetical protein
MQYKGKRTASVSVHPTSEIPVQKYRDESRVAEIKFITLLQILQNYITQTEI